MFDPFTGGFLKKKDRFHNLDFVDVRLEKKLFMIKVVLV